MADNNNDCKCSESDMDRLLSKHKEDRKELQAKIQKMKHAVPKGDKKRKKQAAAEIEQLELELKQRHQTELAALKMETMTINVENHENDDVSNVPTSVDNDVNKNTSKMSRAQKRKEKLAAKERERQQRIAEAEAESVNSERSIEINNFKLILEKSSLVIHEVPPDGNCLYNAVADQLSIRLGIKPTADDLRQQAADYMLAHEADFLPFLAHQEDGSCCASEEFIRYCDNIKNTMEWGGLLEIEALSKVYQVPIDIYQATSSTINVGGQYEKNNKITLSFHQHQYTLGNHYNSLRSMHIGID